MSTAETARRIIAEYAKSGEIETLFHLIDDELRHLLATIGGQQITIQAQQDVIKKHRGIIIHEIATDGLPDMDKFVGRVAFIFDGCIVSGWPLDEKDGATTLWEADSDVGHGRAFYGVTHWVEFPMPIYSIK